MCTTALTKESQKNTETFLHAFASTKTLQNYKVKQQTLLNEDSHIKYLYLYYNCTSVFEKKTVPQALRSEKDDISLAEKADVTTFTHLRLRHIDISEAQTWSQSQWENQKESGWKVCWICPNDCALRQTKVK